jgi:predicted glycosyltransferase
MSGRVMFYAQHLLGVGHIKRASIIARAMVAHGLDVWVVLGGPHVQGIRFDGCARILLPPIHAGDAAFSRLVDEGGAPINDDLREARVTRLLRELAGVQPDVLLIEQFPFGRRAFRFELMPLLTAARIQRKQPRCVSSVRDVLVHKASAERRREMVALARTWFDRVLVHGDPNLIPLQASLPEAEELAPLIRYTGYVVEPTAAAADGAGDMGAGEIIVSAGGGAVGESLIQAALEARPLTRVATRPWRLICGPNMPQTSFTRLAWDPPAGVVVERWRADLPMLLRNCVLSISQAGYNTVMDLIQAGARALVVPFAEGNQTEQAFRARVFASHGLLAMLDPATLTPENLARAVDAAVDVQPAAVAIDLSGATATAREVAALCQNAQGREAGKMPPNQEQEQEQDQ